jgi:hypothetical protein
MSDVEVRELVPGQWELTHPGGVTTVVVPAGVGVPGVLEEDLVAVVADWYRERGRALPAVVDLSALFVEAPAALDRLAELAEAADG